MLEIIVLYGLIIWSIWVLYKHIFVKKCSNCSSCTLCAKSDIKVAEGIIKWKK